MALTPAEKQRRYREKRKLDPAREREYKEKHKQRNAKRKKVVEVSVRERRQMRREWRNRDRIRRQKRAARAIAIAAEQRAADISRVNGNVRRARRVVRKDRAMVYRENIRLRKQLAVAEEKLDDRRRAYERMKKRSQRLAKERDYILNKAKETQTALTPSSKMKVQIASGSGLTPDQQKKLLTSKVARTLVFHNTIVGKLKSDKNSQPKRYIRHLLLAKEIRKYRLFSMGSRALGYKDRANAVLREMQKRKSIMESVRNFFVQDDVSRATAGKKETVTCRKRKMQKRWLLAPMKQLHQKFIRSVKKIGYSTFVRYKPFWVRTPRVGARNTCLCQKHTNIDLLVEAMHNVGVTPTAPDSHSMVTSMVCDKSSMECMYNRCNTCKDRMPVLEMGGLKGPTNQVVKWEQWSTKKVNEGGKAKTVTRRFPTEAPLAELILSFEKQMIIFKKHIFNIKKQSEAFKTCQQNLENDYSVAILVDFSESYDCKFSEEVQSHHFGGSRHQVSIQTGVLYSAIEPPFSFSTVSSNMEHGPAGIWAHLQPILDHVGNNYPDIQVIHFFSDGPCSQYRQKKNFYLLCDHVKKLGLKAATWSFFEASHGKGPADGVGGGLKRLADGMIAHGKSIPDAESFYRELKPESKVSLFYVEGEKIASVEKTIPQDIQPVPETMKLHQVVVSNDSYEIRYREVSCYCKLNVWDKLTLCDCNCKFKTHLLTSAEHEETTSDWSSSSEEQNGDDDISLHDETSEMDSSDVDSNDDQDRPITEAVDFKDLKPGKHVLVKFSGGARSKTTFQYVGVIQKIDEDDGDVNIMFLKCVGENCSLFRMDEADVADVQEEQIVGVLPDPILRIKGDSRVYYKFPARIDVFEKH